MSASKPRRTERQRTGGKPRRRVVRRRQERNGQRLLQFPLSWGGKRPGAGRKPKGQRAGVAHRKRAVPPHPDRGAVHVTLRVVDGLPSLRKGRCLSAIWSAFVAAKDRFGMRLVHFAVQRNHLHLIIEAGTRTALMRGMRGLTIRLARQLNKALGRTGRVWADRYHLRVLSSLRQVRNALAYVLQNQRRHVYQHGGWKLPPGYIDPCSSARYFDGFRGLVGPAPPPGVRKPVVPPLGDALARGWRRCGLIAVDEIPTAALRHGHPR